MATILKLAIKKLYPNYQHYTDIDLIFPVYILLFEYFKEKS
jgi:hypothetical protein